MATPSRSDAPAAPTAVRLDLPGLRRQLEEQAHLFDDPRTYRAGVADALEAVQQVAEAQLGARRPGPATAALAG